LGDVAEENPPETARSGDRNILIHLSEKATLKAVRVDGCFRILVGDDVEIRGVRTDHMASLVGSVMAGFVPAETASRIMDAALARRQTWIARREARRERRATKREQSDGDEPAR